MRSLSVVGLGVIGYFIQGCSSERSTQFGNLKKRESSSTNFTTSTNSSNTDVESIEFDRVYPEEDFDPVQPLSLKQGRSDLRRDNGIPQKRFFDAEPLERPLRRHSVALAGREEAYLPHRESRYSKPRIALDPEHERPTAWHSDPTAVSSNVSVQAIELGKPKCNRNYSRTATEVQ